MTISSEEGDREVAVVDDDSAAAAERVEEGGEPPVEEEPAAAEPVYQRKTSVSEAANAASGGWDAPWWLSWFEFPFHVKDPKDGTKLPEVAGWAMDSAARGPLNQVGSFVGNAVLILATLDAGCKSPVSCTNTVTGGLRPSSLLTATSSIVGVVAAITMPFVGAVVDHTQYRKLMGIISGVFVVGMTGIQISISAERDNWLFILVIDAIQSFSLLVHMTSVFAYLPDLTTDEDAISHYTSHFNIRQHCSQFVFTSLIIITGEVRHMGKSVASAVQTAKDSTGIAFGLSALFIGYAWTFLFRKRPALSKVPDGHSLLTTGFIQVQRTSSKIWADYRTLRWFMISLLWSPEAGAGVVLSIAVSFLTVDLLFTGQDIARISLLVMTGNVFGALFAKRITAKINPLNSYRVALIVMAVFIALPAAILDSPDKRRAAFGLSFSWGFSMGWVYPTQKVLFCTLIPKGQETEMMGLFTFCGQILGWLPPLIVTLMNENGIGLRYGLVVVSGFCVLATVCTLFMGSYRNATSQVAYDSEAKLQSVLEATTKQNTKNTTIDTAAQFSHPQLDNGSAELGNSSAATAVDAENSDERNESFSMHS